MTKDMQYILESETTVASFMIADRS